MLLGLSSHLFDEEGSVLFVFHASISKAQGCASWGCSDMKLGEEPILEDSRGRRFGSSEDRMTEADLRSTRIIELCIQAGAMPQAKVSNVYGLQFHGADLFRCRLATADWVYLRRVRCRLSLSQEVSLVQH
ncbi:hypothetical protein MKW98_026784 [Papaver atlanticum]|uniref:Uncharacterized protein n=1 Tax=Papaver atlanticum TaxID=357466 RepID=A0AAD4S005_9MAGN|nr:hypothetical protein MKW98_026784 [Papaver atlanticum]